jgi:hypothetical protein
VHWETSVGESRWGGNLRNADELVPSTFTALGSRRGDTILDVDGGGFNPCPVASPVARHGMVRNQEGRSEANARHVVNSSFIHRIIMGLRSSLNGLPRGSCVLRVL